MIVSHLIPVHPSAELRRLFDPHCKSAFSSIHLKFSLREAIMPTQHHILFYGRGSAGKSHLINKLLMALFGVELLPKRRSVPLAIRLNFVAPHNEFHCNIDLVHAWERDEHNTWTKCSPHRRETVCKPRAVTEVAAGIELALSEYEAGVFFPIDLDITVR